MSDDFKIQVNLKSGEGFDAAMVNIRANNAAELAAELQAVASLAGEIASVDALVKASFRSGAGATPSAAPTAVSPPPAATPPADPWAAPAPAQAPATPAQVPPQGVTTTTDRYGNRYTHGLPTAPRCAHGVMALKEATSKQGKPYSIYVCTEKAGGRKSDCQDIWPDKN